MTASPPTSTGPHAGPAVLPIALALSSAFLIEALDGTILVSAIPAIANEFGIEPLRVNIAVSIYLMTVAIVIPLSGWVSDRFGARRVFLTAMACFMLASLGSALSPNMGCLIVTRILQGIAGGLMAPVGRLLLIRTAPKAELANAITWMSTPALIGPVLGPLLGGVIVTYASWRWIFVVCIPLGLAGMVIAAKLLPRADTLERRPFDGRGFALCALGLGALQLSIDQVVHPLLPPTFTPFLWALAPAILGLYWFHARHLGRQARRPVLELDLMKVRLFRTGFIAGGLSRIGLNAAPFLLQLQLQLGFHWSAAKAGAIVFAVAAGAMVLKPLMRRVLSALGFRMTLGINGALGSLLAGSMAFFTPASPIALILAVVVVYGITRSLQFNTVNALLYSEVPAEKKSASTALGGVGQQLSMALGISLAAAAVAQLSTLGFAPDHRAISAAMLLLAAVTGLSALIFVLTLSTDDGSDVTRRQPRRQKSA